MRVDIPEPGHYWTRAVRGGPKLAVKIFNGPPLDPETHEVLDRSWRLQAYVDGKEADPYEIWTWCADNKIDEAEYVRLLGNKDDPNKRVDLSAKPPLF